MMLVHEVKNLIFLSGVISITLLFVLVHTNLYNTYSQQWGFLTMQHSKKKTAFLKKSDLPKKQDKNMLCWCFRIFLRPWRKSFEVGIHQLSLCMFKQIKSCKYGIKVNTELNLRLGPYPEAQHLTRHIDVPTRIKIPMRLEHTTRG